MAAWNEPEHAAPNREISADRAWTWRRRFWRLLIVAALLGLLLGILESDAFRCERIVLIGPRPDILEDVKALLSDIGPTSTVLCPSGRLSSMAKMIPTVARITIRKKLPHEIHMYITPRTPAAAVQSQCSKDWFMLVDEGGFVYEPVRQPPPLVPRFRCFPTTGLHVGKPLPPDGMSIFQAIMAGMQQSPCPITMVDFAQPLAIVAFLRDGTKIKIGGLDNLQRKFALAGAIWRALSRRGQRALYIDVRIPSRPTVMLREQEAYKRS